MSHHKSMGGDDGEKWEPKKDPYVKFNYPDSENKYTKKSKKEVNH